jgi:hypothetical protein
MESKVFNMIGSTSIHGEFPVKITVQFQHHHIHHACECTAEIAGKTYEMNYNLAFAPADRIQAGFEFAKEVGCKVDQSIRCNTSEVSEFVSEIRNASMRETIAFEEQRSLHNLIDNA